MTEEDGSSLPENEVEDPPADPFEGAEPVPLWTHRAMSAASLLSVTVYAILVLEQWAVWLLLTSQIWQPWGMVVGIAVAASQMLLLFESSQSGQSCSIPR